MLHYPTCHKGKIVSSLLFLFFFLFAHLNAQEQGRLITGTVLNKKVKTAVDFANVRLLNSTDSTLVKGTITDSEGKFSISVNSGKYILHISFLGCADYFKAVDVTQNSEKLGKIYLSENSILLQSAVVVGKAVDIVIKDDTLEYNANAYKVQETAVVEDLLKKMTGVDIDENGIITVNGKEVKRILIDGKEFFTDDPKIASKNLPAKMIDKIQVIDQRSEMAQMTGFFDGDEETVLNLTIKPEMKRSIFGDITSGYGSDDKYGLRGMSNYMDDKTQMSLLLGSNNTNNIGFSDAAADIYAGNRPPGGMNFGGNNGLSKTFNSGFNFGKKYTKTNEISGDAYYGNADNDVTIIKRERQYIGTDKSILASAKGNNKTDNLKANLRISWALDSVTRIIFRTSVQYAVNDNNQSAGSKTVVGSDTLKNTLTDTNNSSDGNQLKWSGTMTLSRSLNKAGRKVSLLLSANLVDTDRDGFNYSETSYPNSSKKSSVVDQYYVQDDKSVVWRANLSYVEPVGKNNFIQLKYNVLGKSSETDKKTYKGLDGSYTDIVTNSTRNMQNDYFNHQISLAFKSTRKRYNYIVGIRAEPSTSKTEIVLPNSEDREIPKRNFLTFSPTLEFNYKWNKRHNLRVEYKTQTVPASTLQLYDGVISQSSSDSLRGNPNLRPRFTGTAAVRYQKYNTKSASMLIINANFSHTDNDIVIASSWDGTKRLRMYENINGNLNSTLRVIYNTPIKKLRLAFNTNTYVQYKKENTYINTDLSSTARKNTGDAVLLSEKIGLRYNSDLFDFDIRGDISYRDIQNSIATDNDRQIFNYGSYANLTFYLPFNIMLSSDLTYSANSGYNAAYKQSEWMWNATFAKEIFKQKNGIIRLNVYDILKQRSNISERSTADYLEYRITNTIGAYAMLNFVYKFTIARGG